MTSGVGEPDSLWSDPSWSCELRMRSFSALLHALSSVIHLLYSSRHTNQLDGRPKWNLTSMGRLIALIFDEEILFEDQYSELQENSLHAKEVEPTFKKSSDIPDVEISKSNVEENRRPQLLQQISNALEKKPIQEISKLKEYGGLKSVSKSLANNLDNGLLSTAEVLIDPSRSKIV